MTKAQEEDYKRFYVSTPDMEFSPARNEFIIEETIRKTDEYRRKKIALHKSLIRERANAVTDYLYAAQKSGKSDLDIEKYFGKTTLAHLRGQDIVNKLKAPSLFTT